MNEVASNKRPIYMRVLYPLLGAALGVFFLILDAFIMAFIIQEDIFLHHLLYPDSDDIWMRSSMLVLSVAFGLVIQLFTNKTERVRRQLQVSETKFRNLVETSQDLIWRLAQDRRFIYLNPAWEGTLGYSLKEMIGHEFTDFKRPEDRETSSQRHQRTMQGETLKDYETTYISKTGGEVILYFKGEPLLDASGQVVGAQGTATDITKLKQAENKLKASQRLLQTVFDTIPFPIFVKDRESRFIMVNQANADSMGLELSDFRNKVTNNIPIGTEAEIARAYEQDKLVLERGERVEVPEQMLSPPGGEAKVWHLVKVPLKDDSGNTVGIVGMRYDLTERKQAEEELRESEKKYRMVVETALDGIFVVNNQGYYVDVNPMASKMTGYERDELLRMHIQDLVDENEFELSKTSFEQLASNGLLFTEHLFKRKDGTFFPGELNSVTMDNGLILGVLRDITDRKLAEGALRDALKEKEELLKEIHHRVKNNLQVVSSLISLQANKFSDDSVSKVLKESQSRILAMGLIHETLYQSENFASLDLVAYFSKLVEMQFEYQGIDRHRINVELIEEKIAIPFSLANPLALILNELLSNSLKHAFPDDRTGTIRIEASVGSKNDLELIFSDNGVGTPEDLDTMKSKTMGLKLVVGIVEKQLQGTLEMTATEGIKFQIRCRLED